MSKFIAGTTPVVCYTKIPNSLIRDKEISEGAFRLICWVSSHTPDFEFSFESIKEALGYGREKLRSIIKESEAANYLVRRRLRLDNGSFDWEYHIFLDPDDAIAYKNTIDGFTPYGENHSHQGGQTRRVVEPPVAEPVDGSATPYIKEQCEKNKLKEQQEKIPPIVPHVVAEVVEEERGGVSQISQIALRTKSEIVRNPNGSEQFPWEKADPIEGWLIEEGFLRYVWPLVKHYTNFKNIQNLPLKATRRELTKYINKAHYEPERREVMLGHWNDYQDGLNGVSDGYSDFTASQVADHIESERIQNASKRKFEL